MPVNLDRDRPTLREWKRHTSRLRWEARLYRAPYVNLGAMALLVIAAVMLAIFALAGLSTGE